MTLLLPQAFASKNIYLSCCTHTRILMRLPVTSWDWHAYYIVQLLFLFPFSYWECFACVKGLRKLNAKLSWDHKTWLWAVRKLDGDTQLLRISSVRRLEAGASFPPTGILLRHKSTSSLLFSTQWCGWPPALGFLGDSPRPFSSPLASPTRKPEIRQLVMNSMNCRWLLFEKNQHYMSMYRLHHPSLNKIIDHPFPKRWCRVGYFKESRDHLKEAEFTLCRVHSFCLGDSSLCGFGCAGLVVGGSAGWWAIASRYQGWLSIKGPPVLTWQRSSAAEHGGCSHLARVYHLLGTIPGTFLACLIKPLHAV